MNSLITVSVGVPVYNESTNVEALLLSILRQKQESYSLEKIIVICDGCTDDTSSKIIRLKKRYPAIVLIDDDKRIGKKKRLMQIYGKNCSEIIVTFDGDIVLSDEFVIEKLISKFKKDQIAIVGANNQPARPNTLVEKLIVKWTNLWFEVRKGVNDGDNAHNVRGCSIALRGSFAKSVKFPENIVSDAKYLYFAAKSQNLGFEFAQNAVVLYRKPDTISDYLKQTKRAVPDRPLIASMFGDWIYENYKIPFTHKIIVFLRVFASDPIYLTLSLILVYFLKALPPKNIDNNSSVWQMALSTKRGIEV